MFENIHNKVDIPKQEQDIMISIIDRIEKQGEQRGLQMGEKRALEKLIKAGLIKKTEAEKVLKG